MELKPYQQEVINDLAGFLSWLQRSKNISAAFNSFWLQHPRTPLQPSTGKAIEPYKNNVPRVPHICIKVPTAGGKTFIACSAVKTIFDAFEYDRKKAVVWLVPSVVILEQTIKHLKDPAHPYRQKISAQFAGRVAVYNKEELMQGSGFSPGSVQEQLSIFVLSFDSLRAKNKEDRKVNLENSNLQSFGPMLGQDEDISLMRVIQSLNPVLIVDESHNAESELSVIMLRNLNPCFILDLTATPRNNSNIISFVDALELKKENMVKLPVIVYNHYDRAEVIHSALQLQRKLEREANAEKSRGGHYIRPIVLFQAQPKNEADTATFQKIKQTLIELKIPEREIKIKTAHINEIKGLDLAADDCPVRYIITVNALKEGWDCPFAYVLASLADKSSAVDVEQILGRVLRQPYVAKHRASMLNVCYVLTASAKFIETLDNIVKGLNKAGFSSRDFKVAGQPEAMRAAYHEKHIALMEADQETRGSFEKEEEIFEMDVEQIAGQLEFEGETPVLSEIQNRVIEQSEALDDTIALAALAKSSALPYELQTLVDVYRMKSVFTENASRILLPQFYIHAASNLFNASEQLLAHEDLLGDFQLSKCDSNLVFDGVSADLYKVDLDETRRDYAPSFVQLDGQAKQAFMKYVTDPSNKPYQLKNFTGLIMKLMGSIRPVTAQELKRYIHRLLQDFTDEQYRDFLEHDYSYSARIREKIKTLMGQHAEKTFRSSLHTDLIFAKASYAFPAEIIPGATCKNIAKSLYEREGAMDNGFEERVINDVAGLPNVMFWTRNVERRQFKLNGFLNHYPDFIIHTQRGKTILLETKGDDRDNSDSAAKVRLGKDWEQKAGSNFKYFMVFDKKEVSDAYRLEAFLKQLREM